MTHISGRMAGAALAVVAICVAPAPAVAAPGLPRTYDATIVDSPEPVGGGSFGWGIASADLTGDQKADLLVAQAQTGPGKVFIFDGVSGAHVDTIAPPEQNPTPGTETLAFVYVETMPDLGSCPAGDGPDADRICDDAAIGERDGIPEIIVGARGMRVDATDGSEAPTNADRPIGRGYVFDGATRAVLKRIDMPQADRMAQATLSASPHFGRQMMSLQGLAPCAGDSGENNAVGVGPCPAAPESVRIGDVDGGGEPDIMVTARNYRETAAQAVAGTQCASDPDNVCTSGKAWVYPGELIAGSDPGEILETPLYEVQNPAAQTGGAEFGGNTSRVGDVNGDGAPEFVVHARNLDYPLKAPGDLFLDSGAAFLFDGASGDLLRTFTNPEPQPFTQFSGSFNTGRPVGDVGATTNPDVLLGAPLQNALSTDDGRVWAFNAITGGGGATGSWQFASLNDPTPAIGGNFGGASSGVGDLVAADAPANEVLIAGYGFDPNTQATRDTVADLHIVNVETQRNLQTIPHPEGARGDGFGVGLAPMGDLNGDGFLDLAASAYLANVGSIGGQGRAYILTSDDSPVAPEATPTPTPTPTPAATPTPEPGEEPLEPEPCANEVVGTRQSETLLGTIAGDTIFGRAGNDVIRGFQGEDCADGAGGRDRINGGPGSDKVLGGRGRDRLKGRDGHDRLYGGPGKDELAGDHGEDLLAGGGGSDLLDGGAEDDRLFGENGRDRIEAGEGRNEVDGGAGNDRIDVRNGERDTVICGKGRDRVRADRQDRLNGCERVMRTRR